MFAASYAQVVMAPVLTDLAREFGVSTGTAGLVVAAFGLPGIALGFLMGPLSDRVGRKPLLVFGSAVLGLLTLVAAASPSFAALLLSRALAGAGASVLFPNVNAIVGDSFPYRERGRASSVLIALNMMGVVIGIPLSGILSEAVSWRLSLAITGVCVLAATALLQRSLVIPPHAEVPARLRDLFREIYSSSSAMATMLGSLFGMMFWTTWSTYIVVYLQVVFDLPAATASVLVLGTGIGVLVGSVIGGRIGDRIGHRPVVYRSVVVAGFLVLAITNADFPLWAAVALMTLSSAVIGMRFPTNSALLTEQAPRARGTMLAVTSSLQSAGLVAGAALGGVLIDGGGFGALGIACFALSVAAGTVVMFFVREERIDLEAA